jgi:nitrite reductase/ring-hydroxylating ferredoxin subunit
MGSAIYREKPVLKISQFRSSFSLLKAMHMHRPLNCEQDAIFDETGKYLRCSMHGFIFDPKTGECQSPVCLGQRLQSLRLEEIDDTLYFAEKHLTLID